ncbi:hypothetical protein MKF58_003065, partial [Klebsiella pneumoniae]
GDRYTPVIETVIEPAPFPDWLGNPSFACLSRAEVVASAAVDEMYLCHRRGFVFIVVLSR